MELIDQVYAVALRTELAKAWERLSNQYMANIFIYVCVCLLIYIYLLAYYINIICIFIYLPNHMARGISVPQPGTEPMPPAVKVQSPNHWATRKFTAKAAYQSSSVQSLSHVQLLVTPWTPAGQASLSITNSWNSLKLMSIELVMPSKHLILCHPLLLLPSVFPSIGVFSSESALHIR